MASDVIIIGAGIVGAACARALVSAGLDVVVVDRGTVAGGTSSACEGNLLLSDKAPGHELILAQYAARLWPITVAELRDELGDEFPSVEYEPKGGLVIATSDDGAQPLIDFAQTQRNAGVEAHVLTPNEARELEPDLGSMVHAAVFYPEDSQVQPTIATEALMASARLRGALVKEKTDVVGALRDSYGTLRGVRTNNGDIFAPMVIVAAGPWSGDVAAQLGVHFPVRPRRGELLVTARMPQRIFHKVYDGDYIGAVGSNDDTLQTSSVVESTKGGTVLIGSSREQVGFDATLRIRSLSEIAAKALRLFPFLEGVPVIRSYGGFRPFMPDHLPVIGEDPREPGLWFAAGHEGAGIGLSLATAALLRDLILTETPAIDASAFSMTRATLIPFLNGAV
tara:strand:- start:5016 stop:6200 length:1185 start_codon:yes stop_codon:yes gene_type:complete